PITRKLTWSRGAEPEGADARNHNKANIGRYYQQNPLGLEAASWGFPYGHSPGLLCFEGDTARSRWHEA
ncbi:MAG TPA: hypothetical protein VJ921_09985, partial [Vicinamibacteria bacterium]|nr:hypothetical protein [Vicinamibacteria bacterium]